MNKDNLFVPLMFYDFCPIRLLLMSCPVFLQTSIYTVLQGLYCKDVYSYHNPY